MTPGQMLAALKEITGEADEAATLMPACDQCGACSGATPISTRMFTDEQLIHYLELSGWILRRAAYSVLIKKAEVTGIALSSGIQLSDNSAYWLRLAKLYKPNGSRTLARADEPKRGEPDD